jgi:hypothetical protein
MSNRINHIAVFVAAIVYFLFGWLWYSILFSHQWATFVGTPMMSPPPVSMLVESFLLGLILAYATAIALSRRPEDLNVGQGVSFAMFMGLAIYGSQTLNNALYEGRPIGFWLLNTGYVVIGFAIIGAIIGGWKLARA